MLKTNLLSPTTPDKAVVTHPSVVAAVVRLVLEAGGIPIIGDSPGGPFTRGRLEQVYRLAGLYEVAGETGAILNFDTRAIQVSHPEGVLMKRLDIIHVLQDVDVVIALPKLKTHQLLTLTGGTKILFGVVPGLCKPGYHGKLAGTGKFADMLLDILGYVKPALMVMDAIVGMDGKGPSAGTPKHMGLVLASPDAVEMDVVAASLVGVDPESVPTIKAAMARGLTTGRLADVTVLGVSVEEAKVRGFKLPPKGLDMDSVPRPLRNVIVNQLVLRPWPNPQRCNRCGVCVQNCPVGAIALGRQGPARVEQSKCIRCYCCHELCPATAIELKRSFLTGLLTRV